MIKISLLLFSFLYTIHTAAYLEDVMDCVNIDCDIFRQKCGVEEQCR